MQAKTYCPVGCCHPLTAKSVEVPEQGQLCRRHWAKISAPMQRQIQAARARARGTADLVGIMAQAVKEARRLDEYWEAWIVVDGSRVHQRFERWDHAVQRWDALRDDGRDPRIISGVAGVERSTEWILARCPWEVYDSRRQRVLGQSDAVGKPDGWTNLMWALTRAHDDHCLDRATRRTVWPNGEQAIAANIWTGEMFAFSKALEIAKRGHE